jgi:hypothetical protein
MQYSIHIPYYLVGKKKDVLLLIVSRFGTLDCSNNKALLGNGELNFKISCK